MHITMKSKMPTYYFLTAFPQIVSRICHPSHETYLVLKSIIAKVFFSSSSILKGDKYFIFDMASTLLIFL